MQAPPIRSISAGPGINAYVYAEDGVIREIRKRSRTISDKSPFNGLDVHSEMNRGFSKISGRIYSGGLKQV